MAEDAATAAAAAAIAARQAKRTAELVELAPDEFDAVELFLAMTSQWRTHPMAGVRLGLDYAALPATAAMLGKTMTPRLFDDIRHMEGVALTTAARS